MRDCLFPVFTCSDHDTVAGEIYGLCQWRTDPEFWTMVTFAGLVLLNTFVLAALGVYFFCCRKKVQISCFLLLRTLCDRDPPLPHQGPDQAAGGRVVQDGGPEVLTDPRP